MAYRRFFVDAHDFQGPEITLKGELFHHIRDVCRFGLGDRFELLTGDGEARLVEIQSSDKKQILARELSRRKLPLPPKPRITLMLSVPKLPKVDWIVEKSVELGVSEIRPFVSDYSFLRKVSEISPARMQRWEKLITGATQQSGRGERLKLSAPVRLEDALADFNRQEKTGGLFPYEGEAQLSLREALQPLKNQALERIWVFVGSEGGFSSAEVELFAQAGLKPVSLGDQILRVETACVALVSVIKYEIVGEVGK